jgi:hypothetical protein
LNIVTGQVQTGHYLRRRRREFLDFMNGILADHPDEENPGCVGQPQHPQTEAGPLAEIPS